MPDISRQPQRSALDCFAPRAFGPFRAPRFGLRGLVRALRRERTCPRGACPRGGPPAIHPARGGKPPASQSADESAHSKAPGAKAGRGTLLRRKDVSETAFQPAHDLAEAAEGDALVAALQAVESGGRQAELFGKLRVGHFAALDAEKFAELAFQRSGHASQARGEFIPDAECFQKSRFTAGAGPRNIACVEGRCRPLVKTEESRPMKFTQACGRFLVAFMAIIGWISPADAVDAYDDAESYSGWYFGQNGGVGYGALVYLEGFGGGPYLAQSGTVGQYIDGTKSFGIYAGGNPGEYQTVGRPLLTPLANGTYSFSARFSLPNALGFSGFNLKSQVSSHFSDGELLRIGLDPATGNTSLKVTGADTRTLNLGSDIRYSVLDCIVTFDATIGTYTVSAKFRNQSTYTTVSGGLAVVGVPFSCLGFADYDTGTFHDLIFDNLAVQSHVVPRLSGVMPNPVVGSNARQNFIINGVNFDANCTVTLRDLTTGEIFPNRTKLTQSGTTITLNPIFGTPANTWSVEVINQGGTSSGEYTFQVIAPAPPAITTQPQSQATISGGNVTFSVSANGTPSPTFQWRLNGVNIPRAIGFTLTVSNAQLANAGNYSVFVSNSAGQVTSTAAKLTVISNVNVLTVPNLPNYSALPTIGPATDSLVVITHGWEPLGFPDHGTWIDDMHDRISQRVTSRGQTNWSVQAFRWVEGAQTLKPDTALNNAQEAGYNLGKQIVDRGWSHVHLIGHSAGSALIQSAAQYIKAKSSITVHLTFLDPYMGWNEMWRHIYGLHADWSDNYLSHDRTNELKSGLTEGPVDHAYNVDVSWRDPNKSIVNQYCPSAGSTPPTACGQIAVSSHEYPHDFYNASVVPGIDPYFPVYGLSRSKEGGGWETRVNYAAGNAPMILGGSPPGPQGAVPTSANPNLQFSVAPSATSSTGLIQVAGSTLSLSTAGNMPLQLAPNTPASAKSGNAAPVLQPTGTAWISVAVDVSANVNFVTFNAQFNSASGAVGLLSVYWNDVQIGTIDERYLPGGSQSFTFPIDSAYLDRNNSLSIRLDQFSGVTSSIAVSDVQTGFAGLPVAPALAISNMVPAVGLVLTLSGAGGFTYHVEASSDFLIWEPVAEVTITTGVLTPFADPDAASFVKRFYRAVSP